MGSDKIRVQFVENSQKYAQEWLYICEGEETPRNKAALLIGLEPGYFNSDLEVWVGDPVTRVTVEGFAHEKLEVVLQNTSTLHELELGELELVVTSEEAKRFEEKWSIHNSLNSLSFSSWAGAAQSVIEFYNLKNKTILCPSNTFIAT